MIILSDELNKTEPISTPNPDIDNIQDIDLLSFFEEDTTENTPEYTTEDEEVVEEESTDTSSGSLTNTNEPYTAPTDASSIFESLGVTGNRGSGDIKEDLMNWFLGIDKLPSDPLSDYLSNAAVKAEFGMMFNVIKNFERLKRLQDFTDKAEEVYFDPEEIITLDPEDLEKRMKFASDTMKNMYEMNRRTISSLKKDKEDEEMEKLKVLLSAIPNHKLKDIISSLSRM